MQLRRAGGLVAAVALLLGTGTAAASNALESPDLGVQQTGRGGAWFVRADDPLAAYFNPAAMAFQASGVHLGAALMFESRCFTRLGPDGKPVSPGGTVPGPGTVAMTGDKFIAPPAETCGTGGGLFPNPNLAAVFRVSDRLAVGLAIVGPHTDGNNNWPESLPYTNTFGFAKDKAGNDVIQPAPNRYMLVSSNALLLNPTLSVAFAPSDTLSFGAGFIWGIATAKFTNFAEALRNANPKQPENFVNDLHATLEAKDMFVPGIVLSALWMPSKNLDLSAWFKAQDSFHTDTADVHIEASYWLPSGSRNLKAGLPQDAANGFTDHIGKGSLKLNMPMEAKLGLRFHQNRENSSRPSWATKHEGRRTRDPLSEELFDLEVNFTWANDSSIDALHLAFQPGLAVNLGGGGTAPLPTNADIPHNFKDVIGVRLGGDFNVLPNRLALRAGGFFETKGQDDAYLGLDFDNAQKGGLGAGATLRLGPVDVSASFLHTWFGTLDNKGVGAVHALSGDASGCKVVDPANPCSRSVQAINGGVLKQSLNEVNLGGTVRF
jgi:long-chain fatty acid transport protein